MWSCISAADRYPEPAISCERRFRIPQSSREPNQCEAGCAGEDSAAWAEALDWAMSNQKDSGAMSNMQAGDILVAHPSAAREHEISIVPQEPHAIVATHRDAIEQAAVEAESRAVDAWATEDHIHVVKVAAHRPHGK